MRYVSVLGLFVSGYIVAMNVYDLVPHSPSWEAAWWKVGLAAVLAILSASSILSKHQKGTG